MEYNHSQYVIEAIKQNVIPQVRMFFEVEDRKNSFVMSRRKKHLQMQTYTRYGTGSVVSRSLSVVEVRLYTIYKEIAHFVSRGCKQRSVQTGSQGSFLRLFALSYGMTECVNN